MGPPTDQSSDSSSDPEWDGILAELHLSNKRSVPGPTDAQGMLAVLRDQIPLDHQWNNDYYWKRDLETCLWLYDTSEVQRWIKQRQGVLCIAGTPGSGKSVLALSVLQEPASIQNLLARQNRALLLGYLVQGARAGVSELVRSFLVQIYDSGYTSSLMQLLEQTLPWLDDNAPDDKLEHTLLECLADLGREIPVVIVIDGVDKLSSEEFPNRLAPFLSSLLEKASAADAECHLIYTEREHADTPRLATIFDDIGCVRTDAHNEQDIRTCLRPRMNLYAQNEPEFLQRLLDACVERAGTCFEVALTYELAASGGSCISRGDLVQDLPQNFPESLRRYWFSIVREALDADPFKKSSRLIRLGWMVASHRSLTLAEFCWLCDERLSDDIAMMRSMVLDSTGSLARLADYSSAGKPDIRDRIVSLIQPSLERYLKSDTCESLFTEHLGMEYRAFLQRGHERLVTAGLQCLKTYWPSYRDDWGQSLPKFTEQVLPLDPCDPESRQLGTLPALESYAGLTYTATYLISHLSFIRPSEEIFIPLGRMALFSMWAHLHDCLRGLQAYGPSVTFLHIVAEHNMTEWLAWAIASGKDYLVKTANGESILHWAVFYENKESVEIICQNETKSEVKSRARSVLIQNDAKLLSLIDQPDQRGINPLQVAATKGYAEIAARLFSYHGEVRAALRETLQKANLAQDRINQSLQLIGKGNHMHFKTGFVVDAEYDAGSALSAAIRRGHIEVVRALIDHGLNWGSIARIYEEEGYQKPEVPGTDHQYADPVKFALSLGAKTVSPTTKAIVRELKNAAFESSGYANNLSSPATPVDQFFTATKVQIDDDTRVSWKQVHVSQLLQDHKILDRDDKITWIHLPANNMQWVEILMLRLMEEKRVESPEVQRDKILRRELWSDRQTWGSARSYISFMKPSCDIDPKSNVGSKVLYMPYIHWETQRVVLARETFLLCKFLLEADPDTLPVLVESLRIENDDLVDIHSLFRRTNLSPVDSSYTYLSSALLNFLKTLKDPASDRAAAREILKTDLGLYTERSLRNNRDLQLIDRYATNNRSQHPLHIRRTLDQSFYYMLDSTAARNKSQVITRFGQEQKWKEPAMLMVDQLWMWQQGNVIVTAFPQRQACSTDDPDPFDMTDVFESIIWKIRSGKINYSGVVTPENLMEGIIKECTGTWMDTEKKLGQEFRFLDMFNISISRIADGEAACYERFVNKLGQPGQQNKFAIDTESYLLQEIKDIQDELRMIRAILVDQLEIIGEFYASALGTHGFRHPSVSRALDKVNTMQDEAERTHQQLNALMDLQQRHATLWEAQSTGLQGNTIMVFTVVTILFLPASFMTSFFALPVTQFQYTGEGDDKIKLTYVVTWITVFTIPFALFFITLAFRINDILAFLSRITGYDLRIAKKAAEAERLRRRRGVLSNPDIPIARGQRSREKGSESELKPNIGWARLWFPSGKKRKPEDPA